MIDFENPVAFFLLLMIPVLYFLRYIKLLSKISFPLNLSDWNGSSFSWKNNFRKILSGTAKTFLALGYVLTVFAATEPIKHHHEKIYSSRGADVVFLLDVSPSMAAKDIAGVSRLEAAKEAIKTLAQENSGHSLGLIEMAGESAFLVPLTMDRKTFYDRLQGITVGELGDGTAIGTGLSTAVYHLEKSQAPKKTIVLITDGENNAGIIHPLTAAHLIQENNISLYVLGLGTKGTVPLEYVDPKTGHVYSGFLESNYDVQSLYKIAAEAGGKFFEVETMSALSQALSSVSKNENVVQSYHIKNHDSSYFYKLIFIAMVLISVAWFIRRIVLQEIL